jgi:hypothetical protein
MRKDNGSLENLKHLLENFCDELTGKLLDTKKHAKLIAIIEQYKCN